MDINILLEYAKELAEEASCNGNSWDLWCKPRFDAICAALAGPQQNNSSIAEWLRRRSTQDMCCIPGRLAGEIADYIEALATPNQRVAPIHDEALDEHVAWILELARKNDTATIRALLAKVRP